MERIFHLFLAGQFSELENSRIKVPEKTLADFGEISDSNFDTCVRFVLFDGVTAPLA